MVNKDRGQSHGRYHAKPGLHSGVLGLEVEVRVSGVDRDSRSGGVFGEDGIESSRRLRLILRRYDRPEGFPKLMDSCQFGSSRLVGYASPNVLVVLQEYLQGGKVADLVLAADVSLVGVDERHGQVDQLVVVMSKIHLTYYFLSCTVISIGPYTTYVKKGRAMDFHSYVAAEMQRSRSETVISAVERARLIDSFPRGTRSLKLGAHRLTFGKIPRNVPRTVRQLPTYRSMSASNVEG